MTPDQYRREGFQAGIEAAKEACRNVIKDYDVMEPGKPDRYASMKTQRAAKGMVRLAIQEISAIDVDEVLAKVGVERAAVVNPLVWTKHPVADIWRCDTIIGTYKVFAISPTASWDFDGITERVSRVSASAEAAKADAQADYEARILAALTVTPQTAPEAVARLVEAANQARMAFAGYVTVQSAIDKLDEALAAMETSHDRT